MTALAEVDTKAGYCSNCRRGSHVLCSSPRCTCQDRFGHPNRPANSGRPAAPVKEPTMAPPPATKGPSGSIALTWEEPPPKASRLPNPVSPAAVDELRANPGKWARIKDYPKASSALSAAKRIRAGSLGPGFEAEARSNKGGSTFYVRFVGR